jgi:serine/threonine-protein kinase
VATDGALKKIGRYEIESLVAEGAMALVYRAHDPELDRTVAIKVLKDEHGIDEEHVNRFLREAKAAGAISHPNIVTIHDVGRTDNTFYITMEFLDKGSLADVLPEAHQASTRQVIFDRPSLARALDVAHGRHRPSRYQTRQYPARGEWRDRQDFGLRNRVARSPRGSSEK